MSEQSYGELIEIENVRLSFPQLGLTEADLAKKAAKRKGKAAKYKDKLDSTICLVKKSDKETIQTIADACAEVAGVEDVSDLEKWPLLDGDGNLRDGDDAGKEGYEGCVWFKVGSNQPVDYAMLDDDGEVVELSAEQAKKEFYPGCYAMLILQPSEYEEGEVTLYLQGILKTGEGERLGDSTDTRGIFQKYAGGKKKTVAKKKAKASKPPVDEEEESEEEEEEEAPKPEKKTKAKVAKKSKPPVDDEEEEEEEAPKPEKKKRSSDISSILD